jgi:hypothetical protein
MLRIEKSNIKYQNAKGKPKRKMFKKFLNFTI